MLGAVFSALALLGAFAALVLFIKSTHNCDYDDAIWFTKELVKDYLYNRSLCWIHLGDFPIMVKNDLTPFFSEEINNRWNNVLNMHSIATQMTGIMDGTPYYAYVIPWENINVSIYRTTIENLAKICLTSRL